MDWHAAVHHTPTGLYLDRLSGSTFEVRLRLRTSRNAPIKNVYIRCAPEGEEQTVAAQRVPDRQGYDCHWWEVTLNPHNPRFHYRFLLRTEQGVWWYNAAGITRSVPTYHNDFQILPDRSETSWVDDAVFYQIFPDRFAVGPPESSVRSGQHRLDGCPVVAKKWGELPNVHQGAREFYGGNLHGITDKLTYLQDELGVNALYLNPIFTAPSSHKYDVASYHAVDPHFGGDAALIRLREATRKRGMRIILDVVPNHCGVEHPWFQDALKDAQAETAEFFTFHKHPEDYESWLGIRSLPKLNYRSAKLKEWMYQKQDSVLRRWLAPPYNLDGWRVDVANMLGRQRADHLGHKVLRGMRQAVKETRPDSYFLGESFFDASSYLQGDQLDATMNYRGFMMPLYHWLTGHDYHHLSGRDWGDDYPLETADMEAQWRNFRASVPWEAARQQFNLLGSHDTPRLLNMVDGDREKAALARHLMFTYPGVPNVYYGDEIGLEGGRDPDNRRCMPWDPEQWDSDWFEGWKTLINLRRTLPALRGGAYQTLTAQLNTVAFLREAPSSRVVCVARRGPDDLRSVPVDIAAIPDGAAFKEALSGAEVVVSQGCLPILTAATQLWVEKE